MSRSRAHGFTLLEIAVALAIVGMGAVTCLQLFSGSLRLQDRASRQSRAVLAARAAMDALLFQPEIRDHTEERTSRAEPPLSAGGRCLGGRHGRQDLHAQEPAGGPGK
ncbi:MAG: type II secretion system protein [Deltaproteobacteria bacterium]|nr:MAG: type II secretion system protein [Deltaproteobacteria bacterium]